MYDSLFAEYLKEGFGKDCIVNDDCFATYYTVDNKYMYIEDAYVKKEKRGNKTSHKLAKMIEDKARDKGITLLLTTVNKNINNIDACINNVLKYGFSYKNEDEFLIYFVKEIK